MIYDESGNGSREEALQKSIRSAVESVGSHAVSGSNIGSFNLVRDRIVSKANRYVRNYRVMEEKHVGGKYEVTIEAEVQEDAILRDARELYRRMEKPRLMVVIPEIRGKDVIPTSHAENVVNQFFLNREFNLIDRAPVRENIKKDELRKIAEGDRVAAAKLGLRSGAEVVVVGSASLGDVEKVRGVIYSSKATVSLKAIRVDNASIYAVANSSKAAVDGIADSAQRKAVDITSRGIAKEIFGKIIRKWNAELQTGRKVEVVLTGVRFSSLNEILRHLAEVRGVTEVAQRNFDSPTAVMDVTYQGDAMSLAEMLSERKLGRFSIEVTSVTPGKINASLSN